jgi:hypothetical protein
LGEWKVSLSSKIDLRGAIGFWEEAARRQMPKKRGSIDIGVNIK